MSDPRQIPSEDLALYAMQALPAEEMAAVAAALRDNPQAQQELARIQGDLALVALSAEQQPAPARAFERLQARMRESASKFRANDNRPYTTSHPRPRAAASGPPSLHGPSPLRSLSRAASSATALLRSTTRWMASPAWLRNWRQRLRTRSRCSKS